MGAECDVVFEVVWFSKGGSECWRVMMEVLIMNL